MNPMETRSWLKLAVVIGSIGATALTLQNLQSRQRLGTPGLKVSDESVKDPKGTVVATNSVFMPDKAAGFVGEPEPLQQIMLDTLPKDTVYGLRRYKAADGFWISSTVVLMGADRSSIHKPQFCLTGQGWSIDKSTQTALRIDQPFSYDLPIMRLDVSKKEHTFEDGRKMPLGGVYVYWFVSGNQLTADHLERQWWMARDLLATGLLQRWAYVTYFAVCHPGYEQATFERMRSFIVAAVPQFQHVQGKPMAHLSNPNDRWFPRGGLPVTLSNPPQVLLSARQPSRRSRMNLAVDHSSSSRRSHA